MMSFENSPVVVGGVFHAPKLPSRIYRSLLLQHVGWIVLIIQICFHFYSYFIFSTFNQSIYDDLNCKFSPLSAAAARAVATPRILGDEVSSDDSKLKREKRDDIQIVFGCLWQVKGLTINGVMSAGK